MFMMSSGKQKNMMCEKSEFGLPDAMLLLLYADSGHQIANMTKLTAYAYLLEVDVGLVSRGTVSIKGNGRGITSPEVNDALDVLLSSGHISKTSHEHGSCCGIGLSQSGAEHISKEFNELPANVARWLSGRRHIIDAMSPDGVMRYLCIHHSDGLPMAVIDRYDGRAVSKIPAAVPCRAS